MRSLCSSVLVLTLLIPTGAYAQFGGIFSAILGTITGPIGGALTDINRIRTEILQTEQQVLWPVALIEESRNYIATIKGELSRMDEQCIRVARQQRHSAGVEEP